MNTVSLWNWMLGLNLPNDGSRTMRICWVFGTLGFLSAMLVDILVHVTMF